jgi:hypothetical protein
MGDFENLHQKEDPESSWVIGAPWHREESDNVPSIRLATLLGFAHLGRQLAL